MLDLQDVLTQKWGTRNIQGKEVYKAAKGRPWSQERLYNEKRRAHV